MKKGIVSNAASMAVGGGIQGTIISGMLNSGLETDGKKGCPVCAGQPL